MKHKFSSAAFGKAGGRLAALLLSLVACTCALAQGRAFTYQGRLTDGPTPANGTYDFVFVLYDSSTGANQIGPALTNAAVGVSNGLFTTSLDFGQNFAEGERWLSIAVCTNGNGAFVALNPLQRLAPTPYAITAQNLSGTLPASQLTGTLPSSVLGGAYAGVFTLTNAANCFNGNGLGLANVNAATLAGMGPNAFWQIGGNAGTMPGPQFLGTSDNQPLEFRVNGGRAFRLEPTTNAPNVLGGSAANAAGPGSYAATIAGGDQNAIQTSAFTSIGGGVGNAILAGCTSSVIGGGYLNTNGAYDSTIAGGNHNSIGSSSHDSTIGGGYLNTIQAVSDTSTIAGGAGNNIQNNSVWSTISGGLNNGIQGFASTIGGGVGNSIQNLADHSFIAGGANNTIIGSQQYMVYGVVGGGQANLIQTNTAFATIGGGTNNSIGAGAQYATVPGGANNFAAGTSSLAAGFRAKALHKGSFVWADSQNADFASATNDQFLVRANGGVSFYNGAAGVNIDSFSLNNGSLTNGGLKFGGPGSGEGIASRRTAGGNMWGLDFYTLWTLRLSIANNGFVGIGTTNLPATQLDVAGPSGTAVRIEGPGGSGTTVSYDLSTYNPAGYLPSARILATDQNYGNDIDIMNKVQGALTNQLVSRLHISADGSVGVGITTPGYPLQMASGAYCSQGGVWTSISDRNAKEEFTEVDPRHVLAKVATLPITQWKYKVEHEGIKHIGPVAQDFHDAFGLGDNDRAIGSVDEEGVALAAIQGLNQLVQEKDAQIQELTRRLDALEKLEHAGQKGEAP